MPGVTISVIIKVPAKTIYEVVTDFESYSEFLSGTREVYIIGKTARTAQVEFLGKFIKTIHYTLDFKLTPNKKVAWTLVEGNIFKDSHGSWTFEEIEKGVTKATYQVDCSFRFFVPKKITKMILDNTLPILVKSFKERAESLG